MTDREKVLLYVLLGALFLIGNGMAYKLFYEPKMKTAESDLASAKADLTEKEDALDNVSLFENEMEWLGRYEPKNSATEQQTQSKLQQLVEREAQRNKLDIKRQDLEESIQDPGLEYHRVRMKIIVNGMESGLYRWLDRLHSPNEFRAVTYMRLMPQKSDDTRIECQIVVEQWFIPEDTTI